MLFKNAGIEHFAISLIIFVLNFGNVNFKVAFFNTNGVNAIIAHTNIETQSAMRQSDAEFSNAISNLREIILTEGV